MRTTDLEVTATLSAQHLTTVLEDRDGVTVMVLGDDEVEVEISDEVGSPIAAAMAYERLAGVAMARAQMLRSEGSNKGWT